MTENKGVIKLFFRKTTFRIVFLRDPSGEISGAAAPQKGQITRLN